MTQSSRQLTLFVDFFIKPELVNEWKEGHRPVWEACSREPECILFDVFEDPAHPGHFRLVEVWDATKKWFLEEQMTKPYYATLWAKTEHTYRKDRVIDFMERLGEGFSYKSRYFEGDEM